MKFVKIPWYVVKGLGKLITFWVVVCLYPFFMLPMMVLEIGGMKDISHKTHKKFEWTLDQISR